MTMYMNSIGKFTFLPKIALCVAASLMVSACNLGDKKFIDFSNGFINGTQNTVDLSGGVNSADPTNTITDHGTFKTVRAVAGDTMDSLAQRAGTTAPQLAAHNGLTVTHIPTVGQEFAIPPSAFAGATTGDIADINAPTADGIQVAALGTAPGLETPRHRVEAGQTAYSIAQLYGVSVGKLAEWNGLGADLIVTPGQELIIPPRANTGLGTVNNPDATASTAPPETPIVPESTPSASSANFQTPVSGSVQSGFDPNNDQDGYVYSTAPSAPVMATSEGKVVLISESTGPQGTIVMLQHPNGLISVYGRMGNVNVAKGDQVNKGQNLGTTANDELMFQFRRGTTAVNPADYL